MLRACCWITNICAVLRQACHEAGSITAWANRHGFAHRLRRSGAAQERKISGRLAWELGYRQVMMFCAGGFRMSWASRQPGGAGGRYGGLLPAVSAEHFLFHRRHAAGAGNVIALTTISKEVVLAQVAWNLPDLPARVNVKNLSRVTPKKA